MKLTVVKVTVVKVRTVAAGGGHRVPAGGAERTAAHESTDREPKTAERAVFLERLDGVGAAGGSEATGGGPAVEGLLIAHHQANQP